DIADSGIDQGSTADAMVHPDFLNSQGHSRIAYSFNYGTDHESDDRRGHGTFVTSVVGGAGNTGLKDSDGYLYGLGVDPTSMLGATRIFDEFGNLPLGWSPMNIVPPAYGAGARISNNSWGFLGNSYDATAQAYDALVRDAQPGAP